MDNGAVAWAVAILPALALDGWLVRTGRPSLTCHGRRHPAVAVTLGCYLVAHFAGQPSRLKRLDPLGAASRLLAPR